MRGHDAWISLLDKFGPCLCQDVQYGELVAKGELCRVAGGQDDARRGRRRDVGPGLLQRQDE